MSGIDTFKRYVNTTALDAIEEFDKEVGDFYLDVGNINAEAIRAMVASDQAGCLLYRLTKALGTLIDRIDSFQTTLAEQRKNLDKAVDNVAALRDVIKNTEGGAE